MNGAEIFVIPFDKAIAPHRPEPAKISNPRNRFQVFRGNVELEVGVMDNKETR
jgi:hypothetical protein